jgi:hypothetical protein
MKESIMTLREECCRQSAKLVLAVPFSTTGLQTLTKPVRYWRVQYSDVQNNSTSHKALGRSFKRAALANSYDNPSWDADTVFEKLREARATLKAAQKMHWENRDAGLRKALEEQEEKAKDADDPKAANNTAAAVEALIRKHRTQESYTRIKNVMQPNSGGGLQRVDVPKRDKQGEVVRDADGMESCKVLLEVDDSHKAILERNQQHFHQADNTPFAGGAKDTVLYDLIGYTGMSKAAKEIVDGKFMTTSGNTCNLLPETEKIIWGLAMPKEIKVLGKKIESEISEEDFIDGFKKWKESTSTSPSGRHLGHYKAIATDQDLKQQMPEKSHL